MTTETNAPPNEKPTSLASDGGSHLDDLTVPDIDEDGGDPDAPIVLSEALADEEENPAAPADVEELSEEAFWLMFQSGFNAPGMFVKDLKPLAISDEEAEQARAASNATYALLRIWYPAALTPHNETIGHLIMAMPFFMAKVMIVREILRARNATPVQPVEPQRNQETRDAPASEPASNVIVADWHLPGQAA